MDKIVDGGSPECQRTSAPTTLCGSQRCSSTLRIMNNDDLTGSDYQNCDASWEFATQKALQMICGGLCANSPCRLFCPMSMNCA
jgi:hypothetical protein